ncbi:T9SS type A sorting domain-containing protein [Luteirhabdus pelagi]|uniref:T9SS type A sorting domain-containing protein n=1 Tax=Luteirhabdus pelagi TaxID=2792783 RepID=UPI00193A11FC|nr:T9SS type A sorting domain-containing protein [Luteirhabdus pelagi]
MKTIFTLLLMLLSLLSFAQAHVFVHTAMASNISGDASFIDHPLLNENPGAQLVVSHVWNPPGLSGVYNNNRTGVYYSDVEEKWSVYNENATNMIEGSSYFVYVEQGGEVYMHTATVDNQGGSNSYTVLDHPDINGDPEAQVVVSTYYNGGNSRNDFNYGTWYDGSNWILFTESGDPIELGDTFFVAINGSATSTERMRHVASAGTISGNWTTIDHPMLNNNPDARFVFFHNWGEDPSSANVLMDKALGAWYTGTNWAIYTEDQSSFAENAEFDLIMLDPALNTSENIIEGLTYAPNPVSDIITVQATEAIQTISIYTILGLKMMEVAPSNEFVSIDMSDLAAGNYIAKIETDTAMQSIKLIKN